MRRLHASVVSTWVEYGLAFVTDGSTIDWRLPMALQGLPAILVIVFVWFIPESPRWYVAQGEVEKARQILVKYAYYALLIMEDFPKLNSNGQVPRKRKPGKQGRAARDGRNARSYFDDRFGQEVVGLPSPVSGL